MPTLKYVYIQDWVGHGGDELVYTPLIILRYLLYSVQKFYMYSLGIDLAGSKKRTMSAI